ncbi:glycosyltransferase [Actinokineospora sp.]|uniref:glycosyltransferase n=1 Tax=Actinokineospora sp. TaxID=1872133 RepID=UPI0040376BEB
MGTQLTVVVPALNEERRLPTTLTGLTAALACYAPASEIVVVDNGSTDRTAHVVAAHSGGPVPVRLMQCAERGKGAAVRAGILASDSAFVGFCDADLATGVDALAGVLVQLGAGVNVVVGSRAHPGSTVCARHSAVRLAGAWAFRRAVRELVPGIGDTQCGFKFFDRATAHALFQPLRTVGFAFDVELLARAQRAGLVVSELPVQWTDVPGSSFDAVRDGYRSFLALLEIRAILAAESAPSPSVLPAFGAVEATQSA